MKHYLIFVFFLILFASCSSVKHMAYFGDMHQDSVYVVAPHREIQLRPGDKIMVVVNSKDQKLANLFNLSNISDDMLSDNGDIIHHSTTLRYTVDGSGNIDFPVMGLLHIEGLTRDSVAKFIKKQLIYRQLLTDAVVNVEFCGLYVSVLGEVHSPGRYAIERDWFTIIDAISVAGDLTANGNRSRVLVVRSEEGGRRAYWLDLRSGASIYSSPAYYLCQDDVIYIEPIRAGRSK